MLSESHEPLCANGATSANEMTEETPTCKEDAGISSPGAAEDPQRLSITLESRGMGEQQQLRTIREFAAEASQALLSRGFDSVRQGIVVEKLAGKDHRNSIQLVFPCEVSARGAYLLFNGYHWESSDGCHCVVIELWSKDLQKQMETLDSQVRLRFFNPDEVTPSSIMQFFH